jgi:dipeptidyl-peptidase-4
MIIAIFITAFGQKKELTLEDIYLKNIFETASLGEWNWLPGSQSEFLYVHNELWNTDYSIYRYNIETGDTSIFLHESTLQYDGRPIKTDDFWISEDQSKLLIRSDTKRIWRHSRLGVYFIVILENKEIHLLADGEYLRNVKFAPDGEKIAYVKSDNNLYAYDVDENREKKLTKDGSKNILNGHFGWVYEEEFGSYDAYRWSPDSKSIAFWREDQSQVKRFTLIDEMKLYPTTQQIYYPKAGENNPTMAIGIINVNNGKRKWLDLETEQYYPLVKWIDQGRNRNKLIVYQLSRKQNHLNLLMFDPKTGNGDVLLEDHSEA